MASNSRGYRAPEGVCGRRKCANDGWPDTGQTLSPSVARSVLRLRKRVDRQLEVAQLVDECVALASGDQDTEDARQAAVVVRLERLVRLKGRV